MLKLLTLLTSGWLLLFSAHLSANPQFLQLLPRIEVNTPAVDFPPDVEAWLRLHPEVKVGIWGISQPPISLGMERGVLGGMDADYLAVIESTLNVKFSLLHYRNKQEALNALNQGQIQMLAVWNPTIENWQPVDASIPWLRDASVMVLPRNQDELPPALVNGALPLPEGIASLPLFTGGESFGAFQDYYHAINQVAFGHTPTIALNKSTARYLTRDKQLDNIWLVPHPSQAEINFSFGVEHHAPQLLSAINQTLNHLPLVSRLRIAQAWGVDDEGLNDLQPLNLTAEEQRWLEEHQPLTVLVDSRRAPFSFINQQGQPDGLSISVLRLVADRFGLPLKYEVAHNDAELTRLMVRNPQAILAQKMSVPGEAEVMPASEFITAPWLISPAVLLMDRHIERPASLHELAGERIAILRHSPLIPWLETWYPKLQLVKAETLEDAVMTLHKGQVRGVIASQFAAQYQIKRQQDMRLYQALSLPLKPINFGFGLVGNNEHALSILNKALRKITPETLLKLAGSWREASAEPASDAYALPSLQLLGSVLAGMVTLALLVGLWIRHLHHRVVALAENLQHRQTLIEQLEAARDENAQLVNARDAFIRSIGHELRTPLNALIGLLELEIHQHQSQQQPSHNLQTAYDSACSLQMMASDLIDIFRAEYITPEGHRRAVELPSLLNSVVALYRQQAEEKGLAIAVNLDKAVPRVECDPLLIIRTLSSVLSRVIRHCSQGEITVTLTHETAAAADVQLNLHIRYPGQELFSGSDEEPALAEWRQLASTAGASLRCHSPSSERGEISLVFSGITVPLPPLKAAPEALVPLQSAQILVVDDYPPARLLLRQQLKKLGYSVLTAEDGQEGLALWQQHRQHLKLIITDCTMPEMDGFELTRRIRESEHRFILPALPIYGLTAMSQEDAHNKCLAAGMNACLTKPLLPAHLQQMLATSMPPALIS